MIQQSLIAKDFCEKDFIKFLIKQGLIIKTNTKARGNLGIFCKNRIDISRTAKPERRIPILAHEYAHKIHYDLEKKNFKNGGSLEILFKTNYVKTIQYELLKVTEFIDNNSACKEIYNRKNQIKQEFKKLETIIKKTYPDFQRSKKFKEANSYFRKNKTKAKYLLKHDNVKLITPFLKKEEFYSIKTIENDFPQLPIEIQTYIKIKSLQREQNRLSAKINKAKKYYQKPSELFARLIEGLFIDKSVIEQLAPYTYMRFVELLENNYYGNLKELLYIANIDIKDKNNEISI